MMTKENTKKAKVKGFTLIELIVVMAIFGIIMFGALQLITPVMKMMVTTDVHEGGNAAVTSISSLLETELSTAEYLRVQNTILDDAQRQAAVNDFVTTYYDGVIQSGSTVASPTYGNGLIHVLQVDNTNNGKVSTWVYSTRFEPLAHSVTLQSYNEWAVNKAYYDNYRFELKPGSYTTMDAFDNVTFTTEADMQSILMNLNARETAFTIKATTTRNHTDYSFLSTSTMSLVNLYNRKSGPGGPVTGLYYVVDKREDTSVTPPVWEDYIADRGSQNLLNFTPILSGITVDTAGSASNDGYTFIYSYGAEIDTEP